MLKYFLISLEFCICLLHIFGFLAAYNLIAKSSFIGRLIGAQMSLLVLSLLL